jgi:glycosyltransferase involved in cell wall biosynthesis
MSITILTALYNGVEFLEETVRSVIAQKDMDWKMYIGVNGHGETGGEVAEKAHKIAAFDNDRRIHVFVQPPEINNKSKSLNDLVKRTTTDWVCVLDADDIWLPEKLSEQRIIALATDFEVIGTGCIYFGEKSGSPPIPYGGLNRGCSLNYNPIINSSVLFKKKYAYWSEEPYIQGIEDYDMWLRLDYIGVKMFNIDKRLVLHRIHSSSSFNTKQHDVSGLVAKYSGRNWSTDIPRATVVTAFYPLSGSKHSTSNYINWMQNICKIPCNLVVFTSVEIAPFIKEMRGKLHTQIIVRDFSSFKITSPEMQSFWKKQYTNDPEKKIHSPELYAVWAMKQECVMLAIENNYFSSDWFVWCDIGIQRESSTQQYYMNFPNQVAKLCEPGRISFLEVDRIPDNFVEDWKHSIVPFRWPAPNVTLGGGCIAGDIEAWKDFSTAYVSMLAKFEERGWFAGKDQIVYFAMCMEKVTRKPFRLFFPAYGRIDHWMVFPVILGGDASANIDDRFE